MVRRYMTAGGLALLLVVNLIPQSVGAADKVSIQQASNKAVQYAQARYESKGVIAIDDWTIIGLALSGESIDAGRLGTKAEWKAEMSKRIQALDPRKTTDYARFILTVIAAGEDPTRLNNVNLIDRLKKAQLANGKFADSIDGQGQSLINAHVWSMIALYASGEQIPRAKQAKSWLLSKQLPDGGFQFYTEGKQSGVDMTAMTLIAFRALGMSKEEEPIKKAIAFLRNAQSTTGGYLEGGVASSESVANVISGLIAWNEDPQAWKKGTGNLVDHFLSFQKTDGSFTHTKAGTSNQIATAQALLTISDMKRESTYIHTLREAAGTRKLAKLQDLSASFWAYKEMSYLIKNGYLQGVTSTLIQPSTSVTRAQYAALLLRAIGEEPSSQAQGIFTDVSPKDWTAPVVEKASSLGLMQGSKGTFRPHQGITQEEMAVISARVAQRYGWKKSYTDSLSGVDYKHVSSWAKASVQDLQQRRLLGGTLTKQFIPKAAVTRADAAVMLFRLLATR